MSMLERTHQQGIIIATIVACLYGISCLSQAQARVVIDINPPTFDITSLWIAATNSMSPTLHQGDGMIVDSHVPFNSLKIGDIIVFRTNYTNSDTHKPETIIHRIDQTVTDPDNGQRIIRTKGDANPDSILRLDYPIFQQNYIGKAVSIIPQLGVHLK